MERKNKEVPFGENSLCKRCTMYFTEEDKVKFQAIWDAADGDNSVKIGEGHCCLAFPKGIPDKYITGEAEHQQTDDGQYDNGWFIPEIYGY